MTPPLAITFDFWDTLVHAPTAATVRATRQARVVAALAAAGHPIDPDEMDRVLQAVRREFDRHWIANEQFTGVDATRLLLDLLGVAVDDATMAAAIMVFTDTGDGHPPALTPNIAPTLRALQERGVRLGIICDVGLSPSTVLRSYLEQHGVLELFDHWSFSDEVGHYKPSPLIFRHALDGLGVDPAAAAHVGDLRRTDVAGALAFGMTAVRYAGSNDDGAKPEVGDPARTGMELSDESAPEAHHVITDHAELLDTLGY